ncbi:MAG: MOSC domain-containing protein YiiM [Cellvibrionaceae bacterium]|jgi:MOSC domain-containing protein YiiM
MSIQGRLFARYLDDLPTGKLEWIGLRPARKVPMIIVDEVMAVEGLGLTGDRRCEGSRGSARQATIISVEYIDSITRLLKKESIDPAILRRNLVVSGINLTALRHQCFQIGDAIFAATALCHPCSRMEKALGKNGVAAMLGHGGLCAKIIRGGQIRINDDVFHLGPAE